LFSMPSAARQWSIEMSRIVVFANGVVADPEKVRGFVQASDVLLCADGGTRHALELGLQPDMILGDLDSMNDKERKAIEAAGVPVRAHSRDKNETDLELALQEALRRKPLSIVIVGALGRRLEHTLGNIAMLSDPALKDVDVRLDDGLEEAYFCREQAGIEGSAGDIVSLLPWGGAVEGVRTEGLRWPLFDETLHAEKTRGISNEMLGENARVRIAAGLLLIIHRRQSQEENRAL
jgi:thiamine pyrophosphokinase